jgi:hypothetical protein
MSQFTNTQEPDSVVAGDTLQFTRSVESYPSGDGWTLTYVLSGPDVYHFDATASTDSTGYSVSVAASTTKNWIPGVYVVSAYVSNGTERFKVKPAYPKMIVAHDPASATAGGSQLSFAERVLAQFQSALLQVGSNTVSTASVNGQSYSLQNPTEITKQISYWEGVVRDEKNQARLNAGLGSSSKIYAHFRSS